MAAAAREEAPKILSNKFKFDDKKGKNIVIGVVAEWAKPTSRDIIQIVQLEEIYVQKKRDLRDKTWIEEKTGAYYKYKKTQCFVEAWRKDVDDLTDGFLLPATIIEDENVVEYNMKVKSAAFYNDIPAAAVAGKGPKRKGRESAWGHLLGMYLDPVKDWLPNTQVAENLFLPEFQNRCMRTFQYSINRGKAKETKMVYKSDREEKDWKKIYIGAGALGKLNDAYLQDFRGTFKHLSWSLKYDITPFIGDELEAYWKGQSWWLGIVVGYTKQGVPKILLKDPKWRGQEYSIPQRYKKKSLWRFLLRF